MTRPSLNLPAVVTTIATIFAGVAYAADKAVSTNATGCRRQSVRLQTKRSRRQIGFAGRSTQKWPGRARRAAWLSGLPMPYLHQTVRRALGQSQKVRRRQSHARVCVSRAGRRSRQICQGIRRRQVVSREFPFPDRIPISNSPSSIICVGTSRRRPLTRRVLSSTIRASFNSPRSATRTAIGLRPANFSKLWPNLTSNGTPR